MRLFIKNKCVSFHQYDFDFFKSAQQFEDEINLLKEYERLTGPDSLILIPLVEDGLFWDDMINQVQDLSASCQNVQMAHYFLDDMLEFGLPPSYFFYSSDH